LPDLYRDRENEEKRRPKGMILTVIIAILLAFCAGVYLGMEIP
jgi:hypothetical protein